MTTTQQPEGKDIAIISYITFIGLIIAFVMNSDKKHEFAKFHIRQSLGIALTCIALYIVLALIPFIGWLLMPIVSIGGLVLWVLGLLNAINGKQDGVPFFGKYYADIFKNL
jgi:uncharacterized membrane protein